MKTLIKKIYEAVDGKKFFNEIECKRYEEYILVNRRALWIDKYYNDLVSFAKSLDKSALVPLCGGYGMINNFAIRQVPYEGRTSIVNLKTGKCGKSYCNDCDIFDSKCGWAVAWARYRGEEIPDYI